MKLSNEIYKATKGRNKVCSVDPHLVTAIFAQESGYSLKARNCVKGWRGESYAEKFSRCRMQKECGPDIKQFIEDRVCSDYGIGQINYRNIIKLKMDVQRLATDLTYSVRNSVKILCNFKRRYGKKDINWWSRYNARNKIKRREYTKLVERYY